MQWSDGRAGLAWIPYHLESSRAVDQPFVDKLRDACCPYVSFSPVEDASLATHTISYSIHQAGATRSLGSSVQT
jgi:hypothetical protein